MRPRRLPVRLVKALLACVSTLFALGVAELALRVVDWPSADPVWAADPATAFRFASRLDYRHIQPEYDVAFATNSLGQRDDEAVEKAGPRVLLLGDSFTCGYGVERHETFADQLEARLQVDVVNAGVGGYETIHQLRYFQSRGRDLKPDVVVYAMYLGNDLPNNRHWTTTEDGRLVRVDGGPALCPPRELKLVSLAKRSVWLRRAFHAAKQLAGFGPAEGRPWRPDTRYLALCARELDAEAQADLAEARILLAKLRDEVQASGARLLVVTIPTRVDVEHDAHDVGCDFARPSRDVAGMLDGLGIANLALYEPLRQDHARLSEPLYYPRDGHWNALGHACAAEHLAGWLAGHVDP